MYDDKVLTNSTKVDLNVKDATIDNVMMQLLKHTPFSYRKVNNVLIVLTETRVISTTPPVKGKVIDGNGNPFLKALQSR